MFQSSIRIAAPLVVLAALLVRPSWAQAWADKMFEVRSHNFGTVARGSDTVYRFKFKNIYKETVHIAGVRTSCGCTTPSIEQDTLKTYETGTILARYNTHRFTGKRGATITVTIDKPYYAEVRLRVDGYIRSDIVFDPGAITFENIEQGTVSQQQVAVNYAGRTDWKIVDVRSASDYFEVELAEKSRGNGLVSYGLVVTLKENAPAGYLQEQLILVTNDRRSTRVPLHVDGRIKPGISITPEVLLLGDVRHGESVSRKLVVRGRQPFRIVGVHCDDECFTFKTDEKASKRHFVEVVFNADKPAGVVRKAIRIQTDQGDEHVAIFQAHATILPSRVDTPGGRAQSHSAAKKTASASGAAVTSNK